MLHNLHYAGTIVWSTNTDDDDGPVICPDAHPGIVTKEEFDKVQRLLAARYHKPKEPNKNSNPRELGSSYLLSGIISCSLCGDKVQPHPAKSGQYAYYNCKTKTTLSKNECDCPPQNSTKLEKIVMEKIREDILVDANINHLIDQVRADTSRFSMDYAAQMADLDKKLEQIGRREDRALQAFEMDTITREKYLERMNALKEDRERLEQDKANAEATVGEDAMILTDPKSVSDHATQLREFLETVEPSEWKPIIRTFVKNVSIGYNEGVITYKIPLPDDDPFARRMTSTIDLSGKVPSSVNSAPHEGGSTNPSLRHTPHDLTEWLLTVIRDIVHEPPLILPAVLEKPHRHRHPLPGGLDHVPRAERTNLFLGAFHHHHVDLLPRQRQILPTVIANAGRQVAGHALHLPHPASNIRHVHGGNLIQKLAQDPALLLGEFIQP